MKKIIKKTFASIILFFGAILAIWIFYNLFIEKLPEAEGRPTGPAILFANFLIYMGWTSLHEE